ncbi:CD166 antigen homolog isoform X2 [Denticeps clupeoides]|nr:CD166 antigen homolog isoform X2 [Denticeps clupeoides]
MGGEDVKLFVYNPSMGQYTYTNDDKFTMTAFKTTHNGQLRGSYLGIAQVESNYSGEYICEITTFPSGSILKKINLDVKEMNLGIIPVGVIVEGDNVTIRCNSKPPADRYKLLSTKIENKVMQNQDGVFVIPNIRRHDSGLYICHSELESLHQNATIQISVNYLDQIKCNVGRYIDLHLGQNLSIACTASASQNVEYIWTKDGVNVSHVPSISLRSVNSTQAGLYKLTAYISGLHSLLQQLQLNITVRSLDHTATASTSVATTTMTYPSNSRTKVTTVVNEQDGSLSGSTSPQPTASFSTRPGNHSDSGQPTTNITVSVHFITSTILLTKFQQQPQEILITDASSGEHLLWIFLPLLLLLVVVGFLSFRYIRKKRCASALDSCTLETMKDSKRLIAALNQISDPAKPQVTVVLL